MKIDLTPRDIELLLILANDAVADKLDMNYPDAVTNEELSLIEKLEHALHNVEINDHDILGGKTSNVYH